MTCPIASSRVHEAGWTTPTFPRSPADGADFPPVAIVGAAALALAERCERDLYMRLEMDLKTLSNLTRMDSMFPARCLA